MGGGAAVVGCAIYDLPCQGGQVVQSAASDALAGIAQSMVQANTEIMKLLVTAWVPVPSTVDNSAASFLSGSLSWVVGAVAVGSLLFAAGQLAIRRQADPFVDAAHGLVRLIFVTMLGLPLVMVALVGGDKFSTWIIDASTAGDPTGHITAMAGGTSLAFSASGLQMIVAVLGIIGVFIQIGLLMARSALLVVLVAFWPIAAAASMTTAGEAWFRKLNGWLIAVVLYKPVAAIIYAAAFKLMDPAGSNTGLGVIEGVILILMACIALPALMRFFVPAVAAAGGGKGAGAMAAGLATGAVTVGAAAATGGASMAAGPTGAMSVSGAGGGAMSGLAGSGASGAMMGPAGAASSAPATPAAAPPAASPAGPSGANGRAGARSAGTVGAPDEAGSSDPTPAGAGASSAPTGAGGAAAAGSLGDVAEVPAAVARGAAGAVGAATGEEETP